MSAEIHTLPVKAKRRMVDKNVPKYYCVRCDGDTFKLSQDGNVTCETCHAWMRNLLVGPRDAA